jgi:hypothetical protein
MFIVLELSTIMKQKATTPQCTAKMQFTSSTSAEFSILELRRDTKKLKLNYKNILSAIKSGRPNLSPSLIKE